MKYIVIENGLNAITGTAIDEIPDIKCPQCGHLVYDKEFVKEAEIRVAKLTCRACGCVYTVGK